MTEPVHTAITQYGFEFGAAKVERAASYKGHVILHITTDRQRLEVRITPSGMIRVDGPTKNLGEVFCVAF